MPADLSNRWNQAFNELTTWWITWSWSYLLISEDLQKISYVPRLIVKKLLKVHCTECESFIISFLLSSQHFELSLYTYTSQIWNPAWPLQLMILTIPPLTSRLIMTTKFFQSKYICCLVQMTMDLRHMTFILLVLMDCEVISYVHNNGYGRNFKYRKKVFQAPTIVEYPVFKQFDGKFWQITSINRLLQFFKSYHCL